MSCCKIVALHLLISVLRMTYLFLAFVIHSGWLSSFKGSINKVSGIKFCI